MANIALVTREAIGSKTVDLEWVQVHPKGLVNPDDPDAKIKFLAAEALRGVGGLVFDALGNRFANELGRRDYVTGEMWKNKLPFRLALNKAASITRDAGDEVLRVWCSTCPGHGVLVSKMEDSIEAHYQASLKTGKDPDGGPFSAYPSGKSWDEASGKTGSGNNFYHNVISRADSATALPRRHHHSSHPLLHGRLGNFITILHFWVRILSSWPLRSWRGCRMCARQQPVGKKLTSGLRGV